MRLDFRMLGPLEVLEEGRPVALGGPKQRAVLAVLLLCRRQVISTDRLIDALWGDHPPATASKTLQGYVSHLRGALGDGVLLTRGRGYLLEVDADQVDADRFDAQAAKGRAALERGEAADAAELLRGALMLWRGPALADFAYEGFSQAEAARLDEARLAALEDRIDADLATGEHAALIGELEAFVRDHPLRERLRGQLILALYRSGRQAEALEHYQQARRRLLDELGLEPGRALKDLEQAILAQDHALDAPARRRRAVDPRDRPRRGALLLLGGGLLLLGATALVIALGAGGGAGRRLAPNSVAVLDPSSGKLLADIPVGGRPGTVVAGADAVWTANRDDDTISQIDPASRSVESTTAPGTSIDGIAIEPAGLWITDVRRSVALRIDPGFRSVSNSVRIAPYAPSVMTGGPVAIGAGGVWVSNGLSSIVRIDPRSARVSARIDVGNDPEAIAVGEGSIWVADSEDNTATRIDPRTNAVVGSTPLADAPSAVAVAPGSVWVADAGADQVQRLDPASGEVVATIPVGRRPTALAISDGSLWVVNSGSGSISRIDLAMNRVTSTVRLGQAPDGIAVSHGRLWVSIDASTPPETAPGGQGRGALRMLVTADPGGGDPALYFTDPERAYATCALLLNYPDKPFPQGAELRPEVAAGFPTISDGGRTYTYTIRRGFRFSPPSNQIVTAAAFARAIVRVLSPKTQSYATTFMRDVVGARAYTSGRTNRLTGVTATGNKLIVRLTRPSPDLPARLSTPWFCAVPPDTPITARGVALTPSAGPYYVSDYVPGKTLTLRRNPNYYGPRPRRVGEIDYEIGAGPANAVDKVTSGNADYYGNAVVGSGIAPAARSALDTRYGTRSAAARAGHQRYFVEPQLTLYSLIFNTTRPPFNEVRVRRAVNYALDRRALAEVPFPGGTGRPAGQYIPPGVPGYRETSVYPLGAPDFARARRLAGTARRRVVLYTCNATVCAQAAQIVHDDLARIGIQVEVHTLALPRLFDLDVVAHQPFDLALWNYVVDFPDPFDFVNLQFQSDISVIHASPGNKFDRRMRAVAQLTGARRYQAYEELDHDLLTQVAPSAPFASGTSTELFSARIGCQLYQPIYGLDLGALCTRR
jgi:YVTN family beta-propeller protein